jgi:hypothetical protein
MEMIVVIVAVLLAAPAAHDWTAAETQRSHGRA